VDELADRLRRIKMLVTDVDGVLTRPHIILGGSGDGELFEIKQFSVHDGAATLLARAGGLIHVVLSGRDSPALRRRLEEITVDAAYLGDVNKPRHLARLKEDYGVRDEEIAYIGDDFLDLPVMRQVGVPIAVADATPEMRAAAIHVTAHNGGDGALEEVIRLILTAQGKLEQAVEQAITQVYADSDAGQRDSGPQEGV